MRTTALAASAAILLGVGTAHAVTITETTDFANSTGATSSTDVGNLALGNNTISGTLSGECVTDPAGQFGPFFCNVLNNQDDTQDSVRFALAPGLALTRAVLTVSSVAGPDGFRARGGVEDLGRTNPDLGSIFSLDGPTDSVVLFEGLATQSEFLTSVFGFTANEAGAFSLAYTFSFDVGPAPVPVPAALPLLLGALGFGAVAQRRAG